MKAFTPKLVLLAIVPVLRAQPAPLTSRQLPKRKE